MKVKPYVWARFLSISHIRISFRKELEPLLLFQEPKSTLRSPQSPKTLQSKKPSSTWRPAKNALPKPNLLALQRETRKTTTECLIKY